MNLQNKRNGEKMRLLRSKLQQLCIENNICDSEIFLNNINKIKSNISEANMLYDRLKSLDECYIDIPRGFDKEELIYNINAYYETHEIYPLDSVYIALFGSKYIESDEDALDRVYEIYTTDYENFVKALSKYEPKNNRDSNYIHQRNSLIINTGIQIPELIQGE